jgi:hypothetical protein
MGEFAAFSHWSSFYGGEKRAQLCLKGKNIHNTPNSRTTVEKKSQEVYSSRKIVLFVKAQG